VVSSGVALGVSGTRQINPDVDVEAFKLLTAFKVVVSESAGI